MDHTYKTSGTLEELVLAITDELKKMTDHEKLAFRVGWLSQYSWWEPSPEERAALRLTGDDRRFLREIKIDPDAGSAIPNMPMETCPNSRLDRAGIGISERVAQRTLRQRTLVETM